MMSSSLPIDRIHETQLRIGDDGVQASTSVGVVFDNNLDMSNHINTVCMASFTQLRHLRSMTCGSIEKPMYAFIG